MSGSPISPFTTQSNKKETWRGGFQSAFLRGRRKVKKMGWMGRFLTAVAFLAVGVIFSPETFGSKPDGQHRYQPNLLSFLKLAHLLCFSVAFGAALWVTFIGGIIMFKYLFLSSFLPPSLFSFTSCNLCLNPKGHSFYMCIFFKKK